MITLKSTAARTRKLPALLATLFLSTAAGGLAQEIPADQISPHVLKQIRKIMRVKESLSSPEEKIASTVGYAARESLFLPIGGTDTTVSRTNIDSSGMATVQIKAKVKPSVLALIAANGGTVLETDAEHHMILAKLPLTALINVAASPKIKTIDEPDTFVTNVGAVTAQSYITERADVVAGLGYDGTGVKVGVLSDSASATTVATLEGTGDLPANTVVVTPGTGEDEGCAIMEIIHDLAPGAQPYFNTGTTAATFATAITTLGTLGCKVIVDDISFANEGVFEDDTIARAVNSFVAGGGIYFSSAANSGNLDSGTSGTWEGDFLSGGATASPITDATPSLIHNFGTAANPVLYDALTVPATSITLKWSDPLTGGTDDYDLFVLNSTGTTLIKSSVSRQTGTRAPYESVTATATDPATAAVDFPVGSRVVIVQYNSATKTSATRALHLDTNRAGLTIATDGCTFGHNAAAATQCVAATFWNSGKLGTVPFTGTTNPVELFSSDGPRAIFFNPDGTQIGTGAPTFASLNAGTAGTSLLKPDFTAADGVTCKTTGFSPFFGTSAAGPNAAAIAALMLQVKPTITNTQMHNILVSTALDNMTSFNQPGTKYDYDGGYGVVDAYGAVLAVMALP